MDKLQSYYGDFNDWDDVKYHFKEDIQEPKFVFAFYDIDGYEGLAVVVYSENGEKFFFVEGSHCSCYGLEEQFKPTDHTMEELEKMGTKFMFKTYLSQYLIWLKKIKSKMKDK